MTAAVDIAVVGGGHNGLVAAAYLARAGKRVVVLERRSILGGLAATEELWPGYRVDTGWWDADLLLDEVLNDLDLARHGVDLYASPAATLAPQVGGEPLTLWHDASRNREEIGRLSKVDGERFDAFSTQMRSFADALAATRTLTPPDLGERSFSDLLSWGRLALSVRLLGRRPLMELLRVLPMPARQVLDETFESDLLKGLLAAGSVTGLEAGPYEVGTSSMMLYQRLANERGTRWVRGGVGRVSEALAAVARAAGAEIRTDSPVDKIDVRRSRVHGIVLADGSRLDVTTVVSTIDPKRTLFGLVGADKLPMEVVRKVRNVRFRGVIARLFLGLKELPPRIAGLACDDPRLTGRIVLAADVEAIEHAYDAGKYGDLPLRPLVEFRIPTLLDPTLAPVGKHLMLLQVQFVPYRLREGDWESRRTEFIDGILARMEEIAPGLRSLIDHVAVLCPADVESLYGATGGDVYHGQMALDQLLHMRPIGECSRYRTPVHGLWLAGAGCHPGGGLTGAPGYNAAREILRAA